MTVEPDYITLSASVQPPGLFCVLVMRYKPRDDEYEIGKSSQALSQHGAKLLANSWAAALGVEIR